MLPSTSTNDRMCNTIKSEFLKGVYDREETFVAQRFLKNSSSGVGTARGFTFRPFENDGLKVSKRMPSSRTLQASTSTSMVSARNSIRDPFARSNAAYGSFYKSQTPREVTQEPLSMYELSVDQLTERKKQLASDLSSVKNSLAEETRLKQIAKRRQMLKAELSTIDQDLVETQNERQKRIEKMQAQRKRENVLRGGKFIDQADVPEYMATSLQIDHDANNRQDSSMPAPCFTAEYASTHAYGGQVSCGNHGRV